METNDKEISLQQIKNLAKRLKKQDSKWVKILAEKMNKEIKGVNETKVYCIVNNSVRNQRYRILFVKHAIPLLKSFEKEQGEAIEELETIKNEK